MNNVFSYKYNSSYKFCHTIRLVSIIRINWWEELLLPTNVVCTVFDQFKRLNRTCLYYIGLSSDNEQQVM